MDARRCGRGETALFRALLLGGLVTASLAQPPASTPSWRAAGTGILRSYESVCLALALYHEARGETETGRHAVALVVLNRVRSPRYPQTVCGVVFHNARWAGRCQFSFACTKAELVPDDPAAWTAALALARSVLSGASRSQAWLEAASVAGDAMHYHADYARPPWALRLRSLGRVGRHVFFDGEALPERRQACRTAEAFCSQATSKRRISRRSPSPRAPKRGRSRRSASGS
ncbi:cell wall hydrolase [Nitratireductor sp. ZSWI3]|uniref:cell wall hydrolase n=1 Tax=Nitratireductor sp. ZSWI3 TaxID=2966359 RepID=UPI0035B2A02B